MNIRAFWLALPAIVAAAFLVAMPPAGVAAAPNPALADLTVGVTAPSGVHVGAPGVYAVVVSNAGKKQADGVSLTITLPATHTSPQVYVLGSLTAWDSPCIRNGTTLTCALGTIGKGVSRTVRFTIAFPQNATPLVVGAAVTSGSPELSMLNNTASATASLLYPSQVITAGQNAHNTHCTGTALTAYYECSLFPSSISSHDIQFLAGGTLVVTSPASSGYTGTWSQATGSSHLVMEYFDGSAVLAAHFEGRAVGGNCFEGLTTFNPPSPYVSPYRVCLVP